MTEARNAESTKVNEEAKQAIIDAGGVVRELTAEQRAGLGRRDEARVGTVHRRSGPGQHRRRTGDQRQASKPGLRENRARPVNGAGSGRAGRAKTHARGDASMAHSYEPKTALGRVVNEDSRRRRSRSSSA